MRGQMMLQVDALFHSRATVEHHARAHAPMRTEIIMMRHLGVMVFKPCEFGIVGL